MGDVVKTRSEIRSEQAKVSAARDEAEREMRRCRQEILGLVADYARRFADYSRLCERQVELNVMLREAVETTPCRFCASPAVAEFVLDRGCFCHPNERLQALCPQHVVSAEPLGGMTLSRILDEDAWAWFVGTRGG